MTVVTEVINPIKKFRTVIQTKARLGVLNTRLNGYIKDTTANLKEKENSLNILKKETTQPIPVKHKEQRGAAENGHCSCQRLYISSKKYEHTEYNRNHQI